MRCISLAVLVMLPLLTGCALTATSSLSPALLKQGATIHGVAHGGQQPVSGAKIYLLAANTSGYGGNGVAASAANASLSLLTSGSGTDALGTYVLTGADGSFSISGDYSCLPGQQIYLYGLGGTAGGGTAANPAIGLLAILGQCPAAGTFPSSTNVNLNEVSTVAAAYAFAGFASDATHVSSSSTALAATGIANAFGTAANLETLATGAALDTTPAGNGTVPQATINTIADILAACVNTSSNTSTGCNTLFNNIKSAGATGTTASDTATAAIYLAHNPYPGATQLANLYGNPTPSSPFTPTLGGQPNDFTLSITFSGGGISGPESIAVDAAGDLWVGSLYDGRIAALQPNGTPISPDAGFTPPGLLENTQIAIDTAGNVWIPNANYSNGTTSTVGYTVTGIYGVSSPGNVAGQPLPGSPFSGAGVNNPRGAAFDAQGNLWIANAGQDANGLYHLSEFDSTGNAIQSFTPTGVANEAGGPMAIDASGYLWIPTFDNRVCQYHDSSSAATVGVLAGCYSPASLSDSETVAVAPSGSIWLPNEGGNTLTALYGSNSLSPAPGTPVSTTGYNGGGLDVPYAAACDGAGLVWVANLGANLISAFDPSGSPISPSTGYTSPGFDVPASIAIDGSGNVWVGNGEAGTVTELIGAATPVVTPVVANLLSPYGTSAVNKP
jgi:streptogramin lyase